MPTIHREKGFTFRIYPNDHQPAHVHVFKDKGQGKGEVRIQIDGEDGHPEFIDVRRMSDRDAMSALKIVASNQDSFLREWYKYHGNKAFEPGEAASPA